MAQKTVGSAVLEKADAVLGRIKAADSAALPALQNELSALVATDGLPAQCKATLITMQNAASMAVPVNTLDAMPAEMQESVTAQNTALETRIAIEREACLKADAQQAKPVSTAQESADIIPTETVAEPKAGNVTQKLLALRVDMKIAFDAGDSAAIQAVENVLTEMGKNQDYDLQCRLAAAGMAREGKGYKEVLAAKDDDARNIAEASVKMSALSVNSALKQCQ